MSLRGQAGKQAAPTALTPIREVRRRPAPETAEACNKWSVYRRAIEGGWGTTVRLILILIFSCGIPMAVVAGGVRLFSILWGHGH
jgi:hypothetical protein